ncbi:MAG: hypothetical protein BroJett040_25400 [Oligoflexia bacterium]|nr:MAG: hypothetical protein BroJett040_25400 [Oligoflexia bacterium]
MDEVKFAIKALFAAAILTIILQMKVSGRTLESHGQEWLENSSVSQYLRKVAGGAALAVSSGSKVVSEFAGKAFGEVPHVQKASRLNLELKRSPQVQPDQPDVQE